MNGPCIQKDDVAQIRDALLAADMAVFATPIYYFGVSAQLKMVLDRFYSYTTKLSGKHLKTALITAAWDSNEDVMPCTKAHYQKLCRYMNFQDQGMVLGLGCGSLVAVFFKDRVHDTFRAPGNKKLGVLGIAAASALGPAALTVRVISCFLCGVTAGLLLRRFYRDKPFFAFDGFDEPKSRDTDPSLPMRFLKNLGRNLKATGPMFLLGIVLSALFQRYVPQEVTTTLFGGNETWGVLMAATIGVPLYACGGGTIPLLQAWLIDGMSLGSATAFMITGPATKITNLGALKIVLGIKRFILYIAYVMVFSLVSGRLVNLFF